MSVEVEVNPDFQLLLQVCSAVNAVPNMDELTKTLLLTYNDSYPAFVNSDYFRKKTRKTAALILDSPEEADFELFSFFRTFDEDFQILLKACQRTNDTIFMQASVQELIEYYAALNEKFILCIDFREIVRTAWIQITHNPAIVYKVMDDVVKKIGAQQKKFLEQQCSSRSIPVTSEIAICELYNFSGHEEFQKLLRICASADNSVQMDKSVYNLLVYYQDANADFIRSDTFKTLVRTTSIRIHENPITVYYELYSLHKKLKETEKIYMET